MAFQDLKSILVALITPFTDDGKEIDAAQLDAHINNPITIGAHGLMQGGSTGEFITLTIAERKQLVEICVKSAAGRVPVVAGIGASSTADAIDLATARHARRRLRPHDRAALIRRRPVRVHAARVPSARSTPPPRGCPSCTEYNIPAASGLAPSPAGIADLSDVAVRYLKDTSGNAPALTGLLFGLRERIAAFNGWDTLTFYGLAAGVTGSVWGMANALAVRADLAEGRKLWGKIWPVCRFLESHPYHAAVRTGMELRGFRTGGLSKPFKLLGEKETAELRQLLEDADVKVV